MQKVKLFIADALHLIGGAHGATIEVACSRMRYISVQKQREEEEDDEEGTKKDGKKSAPPIRILGLSASVANAKDLAEWLGVNSKRQFNFAPSARPTPLRLFVRGFDVVNYESRVQAMSRPTYRRSRRTARTKNRRLFSRRRGNTRNNARWNYSPTLSTTTTKGTFETSLRKTKTCWNNSPRRLNPAGSVKVTAMTFGIAVIHEGLSKVEKQALFLAFECNACSLMICEAASGVDFTTKSKARRRFWDATLRRRRVPPRRITLSWTCCK